MKWVKHQLTIEQARAFNRSGVWLEWSPAQVVRFALFQNAICVPIEYYIVCLSKVFRRDIHLNQLLIREDRRELILEYLKTHDPPMLEEIVSLLGDKTHLIGC